MRIEPQILASETALGAPGSPSLDGADYASLLAGLFASRDAAAETNAGLSAEVRREMRDPLGLATRQSAVAPGDSPLLEGRFESRLDAAAPGSVAQAGGEFEQNGKRLQTRSLHTPDLPTS